MKEGRSSSLSSTWKTLLLFDEEPRTLLRSSSFPPHSPDISLTVSLFCLRTHRRVGHLEILFNNAGVMVPPADAITKGRVDLQVSRRARCSLPLLSLQYQCLTSLGCRPWSVRMQRRRTLSPHHHPPPSPPRVALQVRRLPSRRQHVLKCSSLGPEGRNRLRRLEDRGREGAEVQAIYHQPVRAVQVGESFVVGRFRSYLTFAFIVSSLIMSLHHHLRETFFSQTLSRTDTALKVSSRRAAIREI